MVYVLAPINTKNIEQTRKLSEFNKTLFEQMVSAVPGKYVEALKDDFDRRSGFFAPLLIFFYLSRVHFAGGEIIGELKIFGKHFFPGRCFYHVPQMLGGGTLVLDVRSQTEMYVEYHRDEIKGQSVEGELMQWLIIGPEPIIHICAQRERVIGPEPEIGWPTTRLYLKNSSKSMLIEVFSRADVFTLGAYAEIVKLFFQLTYGKEVEYVTDPSEVRLTSPRTTPPPIPV